MGLFGESDREKARKITNIAENNPAELRDYVDDLLELTESHDAEAESRAWLCLNVLAENFPTVAKPATDLCIGNFHRGSGSRVSKNIQESARGTLFHIMKGHPDELKPYLKEFEGLLSHHNDPEGRVDAASIVAAASVGADSSMYVPLVDVLYDCLESSDDQLRINAARAISNASHDNVLYPLEMTSGADEGGIYRNGIEELLSILVDRQAPFEELLEAGDPTLRECAVRFFGNIGHHHPEEVGVDEDTLASPLFGDKSPGVIAAACETMAKIRAHEKMEMLEDLRDDEWQDDIIQKQAGEAIQILENVGISDEEARSSSDSQDTSLTGGANTAGPANSSDASGLDFQFCPHCGESIEDISGAEHCPFCGNSLRN